MLLLIPIPLLLPLAVLSFTIKNCFEKKSLFTNILHASFYLPHGLSKIVHAELLTVFLDRQTDRDTESHTHATQLKPQSHLEVDPIGIVKNINNKAYIL